MPDHPLPDPSATTDAANNSILILVLRRMRAPLITIVLVYAVSILGLTQIPGVDAEGRPAAPMSYLHAFYFVSYTATTIGFGEVPSAFSDAQRMWVVAVIHLTVIGWTYAVLTLISLLQDAGFQRALASIRFGRRVRRLGEPFFLIVGCGDTGRRLIRILDRRDLRFVVVEKDAARIAELELEDFRSDAPVLNADGRSPEVLVHAGLRLRDCAAVLALTDDDRANVAVAAAARLLNPRLPVMARSHTAEASDSLRAFGADHVIDPFETFARHLSLAMRAPGCYRLHDWLTAPPDTELQKEHEPPGGDWVVCGHGRFASAIHGALAAHGARVRFVDPAAQAGADGMVIPGSGSERAVLEHAGIATAEGLVAGTDDDIANLAILAKARQANPRLFTVARQNEAENQALFERIRANLVMRPSEIIAEEALARLTTPLLDRFLDALREQNDAWGDRAIGQLRRAIGTRAPKTWTVRLDVRRAPAVAALFSEGLHPITLGDLLRDPRNRNEWLQARPLLLLRRGAQTLLPGDDLALEPDDQLLLSGRAQAIRLLDMALANVNVLEYLCTGRDLPGGWIWKKLARTQTPGG